MTTVRELRIQVATKAISNQIDLGVLAVPDRSQARAEVTAEAVVDALFPDHLLDNVEVPD